jgi:hypothetical protein
VGIQVFHRRILLSARAAPAAGAYDSVMTAAPLILTLALGQTPAAPKSFEEIERLKHQEYRRLTDFKARTTITVRSGKEQPQTMIYDQKIARGRQHLAFSVGGRVVMESGHDGAQQWVISHPEKQYLVHKGANSGFTRAYEPINAKEAPQGFFNFSFSDGYNLRFDCNPAFKLQRVDTAQLGGRQVRRVTARASFQGDKRYVQLTQFFDPSRWILLKFEVDTLSKEGERGRIEGTVSGMSFTAGLKNTDFTLSQASIKGYKRVEPGKE